MRRSRILGLSVIPVTFALLVVAVLSNNSRAVASGIAAVASVFGQAGNVNIPVTTTDISTPAAPSAGKTVWYTKSGSLCSENPSAVENCVSTSGPTTNQNIRTLSATFSNGGSALSGSTTICGYTPIAGTINQVTLVADQSGSVTVDVKTVAFGSYTGPGSASSITASDTPALSSAVKLKDTTLTGWTTSLSADTVVCFAMSAPTTVTQVVATLKIAAN